jgi:DNA-binding transcriptional LysR family regulator
MLDATRLRVLVAIARHGSVTAAAQALNYAQPSISHHMARLESETGAKLLERSGRGVRLTDAGRLLAERAEEILGRLDAAEAELAAHVGLKQEKVRLAAFGSALGTLAAAAAAALRADRAITDLSLVQAEPTDALRMLRVGAVDVAMVFRYLQDGDQSDSAAGLGEALGEEDLRYHHVLDEPVYLITPAGHPGGASKTAGVPGRAGGRPIPGQQSLAYGGSPLGEYSRHRWVAGCERCQDVLIRLCRAAGFTPEIAVTTDDYVAAQALVAAGLGTAILPGLALRALRHPGVVATELPGIQRRILAATYGGPPEPVATSALLAVMIRVAGQFPADPVNLAGVEADAAAGASAVRS